ncbi:hypothetical protein GMSM_38090 [Geomonas sp. Red276]
MDEANLDIARHWLRKAANDLQNISSYLAALEIPRAAIEVPTDTLCFHAQQAIEKLS